MVSHKSIIARSMRQVCHLTRYGPWRAHLPRSAPLLVVILLLLSFSCLAQTTNELDGRLKNLEERLSYLEARLARQMDELLWIQKLEPIADVDKLSFAGPPPQNSISNALPGSNMVVVSALTFVPKG